MNIVTWKRPTLTNWTGFGRLADLQEEIDRLFAYPAIKPTDGTPLLGNWLPALDVQEDKDNFVVRAELPGMKKEDIEVSLHDGNLSISGERKRETKHEDAEVYLAERSFGRFLRTIALPAAVASDKVQAAYKDGVLTITLPRTEAAKPKQIDVSVN